jgi:hypothetical protein
VCVEEREREKGPETARNIHPNPIMKERNKEIKHEVTPSFLFFRQK